MAAISSGQPSSGQRCLTFTEASTRTATHPNTFIFQTVATFGYGKPFAEGTANEKFRASSDEALRLQKLEEENVKASGKTERDQHVDLMKIKRKYAIAFISGKAAAAPKWITAYPNLSVGRMNPEALMPGKSLTTAHGIFLQYQAACHMSTVSRNWRAINFQIKQDLANQICALVRHEQMHTSGAGASYLGNCINGGWFLQILALYAAYNPIAMQNRAFEVDSNGDMIDDGRHGTLLTSALNAEHDAISPSFIRRLLAVNGEHREKLNFDLLQHRTGYLGTPMHIIATRNAPDIWSILGAPGSTVTSANYAFKAKLTEIEAALKSQEAPNLPPLPAPPVPAGPAGPAPVPGADAVAMPAAAEAAPLAVPAPAAVAAPHPMPAEPILAPAPIVEAAAAVPAPAAPISARVAAIAIPEVLAPVTPEAPRAIIPSRFSRFCSAIGRGIVRICRAVAIFFRCMKPAAARA